jgi:hypothetical protein
MTNSMEDSFADLRARFVPGMSCSSAPEDQKSALSGSSRAITYISISSRM